MLGTNSYEKEPSAETPIFDVDEENDEAVTPSRESTPIPKKRKKDKIKIFDSDDEEVGSSRGINQSRSAFSSNNSPAFAPFIYSSPVYKVSSYEPASFTPSFKLHHVWNVGEHHVLLFLWRPEGWSVEVSVKGREVQAIYLLPPFPLRQVIQAVVQAKENDPLLTLPVESLEWSKEVKKTLVMKEIDEGEKMVYNIRLEKEVVGVEEFVRGGAWNDFVFFQLRVDRK